MSDLVLRERPRADNSRLNMEKRTYVDPVTGELRPDRRSGVDRRDKMTFSALFRNPYKRRKSRGRRKTDSGAYVDLYDSQSWGIAVAILMLSFIDAVLTGMHVTQKTAWEVNPVMNVILNYGGLPAFFGAKFIMTIIPVAVILIHKEWTLGKYAARLILISYIFLTVYHVYLVYGTRRIENFVLSLWM